MPGAGFSSTRVSMPSVARSTTPAIAGHLGHEAVGRLPGRDPGRLGPVARAEVELDRPSDAAVHLGRHEPGGDPGPAGDRLPDLFGGPGNLDVQVDGPGPGRVVVLGAHGASSGSGEGAAGSGWATTTRRWERPPGALASW